MRTALHCLLFSFLLLPGCGDGLHNWEKTDNESNRALFQFRMRGDTYGIETFRAATSDPKVINIARNQLQLPAEQRTLFITGSIDRGNGGYNFSWKWHFTENMWTLAEITIELCDGSPVYVDQALDYWVDTIGRFCPWGSYIDSEVKDYSWQ